MSHQWTVLSCVSARVSNLMPGRSHCTAQDYTMKRQKLNPNLSDENKKTKTRQVSKKAHVHSETSFKPIRPLLCSVLCIHDVRARLHHVGHKSNLHHCGLMLVSDSVPAWHISSKPTSSFPKLSAISQMSFLMPPFCCGCSRNL